MIDSLIETVKQAEQKAGIMPAPEGARTGGPERVERLHKAAHDLVHSDKDTLRYLMIGSLSCFVSDEVWDYCLADSLKTIGAK